MDLRLSNLSDCTKTMHDTTRQCATIGVDSQSNTIHDNTMPYNTMYCNTLQYTYARSTLPSLYARRCMRCTTSYSDVRVAPQRVLVLYRCSPSCLPNGHFRIHIRCMRNIFPLIHTRYLHACLSQTDIHASVDIFGHCLCVRISFKHLQKVVSRFNMSQLA